MFCLKIIRADRKALRLEISRSEICCHLHETGTRISRLGPASETKSNRSEFRPVSCKRSKRKCMEANTNSCWSVLFPVSCKCPPI